MKVEDLALDSLIPYARNPRKNDGAVDKVAASIKEFGWRSPIVVDEEMVILAGHTRYKAAKKLGLTEAPVHIAEGLTEAQKKAYRIADNRVAEEAEWDYDFLKIELDDIGDLIGKTGFDQEELDSMLSIEDTDGLTPDDSAPPLEIDPVSSIGDLWIIGNHRVLCGDSTSIDDVMRLTDGMNVDCCWTDPPYNVNYESKAGKIQNDNLGDSEFRQFLSDAFVSAFAVMKEGAPIYVAHADTEGYNFRGAFLDAGFKLSGCLIWVKNSLVLGRSDYQWRHEPILYGWKPGAGHKWYGGRAKTTVFDAKDVPYTFDENGGIQIEIGSSVLRISGNDLEVEEMLGTTIYAEKPKKNADHPTMKPVDLVLGMLENSSKSGDCVLDLFGGSGSTMIACQKSGRKARLMEFDPKYVDVIVKRWQEFTGKDAIHAETGKTFNEMEAA